MFFTPFLHPFIDQALLCMESTLKLCEWISRKPEESRHAEAFEPSTPYQKEEFFPERNGDRVEASLLGD